MGEKVVAENKDEKKGGVGGGDSVQPKKVVDAGAITVVLKVDLHCEGCAKKVRRSVKHFDGVESVTADLASSKVTVVGKVDPVLVKERVEEKIRKKVELVAPQPANKDAKPDEKKGEEKKKPADQIPVSTVVLVLSTRVNCEGCAHKIKRIVSKYEGVQDVSVDLQKDLVTVQGTMNIKEQELLPYLNTKLKRIVVIAPPPKEDGSAPAKKPEEDGDGEKKGKVNDTGEKKGEDKAAGDGNAPKVEVISKMEYHGNPYPYGSYTYDPSSSHSNGYVVEYSELLYPGEPIHATPFPAQSYGHGYMDYQEARATFSDGNPNAPCSIM